MNSHINIMRKYYLPSNLAKILNIIVSSHVLSDENANFRNFRGTVRQHAWITLNLLWPSNTSLGNITVQFLLLKFLVFESYWDKPEVVCQTRVFIGRILEGWIWGHKEWLKSQALGRKEPEQLWGSHLWDENATDQVAWLGITLKLPCLSG